MEINQIDHARVAELVYAADLKSVTRKGVRVRFPPRANSHRMKKPLKFNFYSLTNIYEKNIKK